MPAFDPAAFDLGFDTGGLASGVLFGFDPFDALMNKVGSILTNQLSGADTYGQLLQTPSDFTSLADNVPMRISDKALGRPHELKVGAKLSTNYKTIFMRPPSLTDGSVLNPHHWILLTGSIDPLTGMINPLPPGEEIYFDIFEIQNPSKMNHHLEIICQQIIP